MSKRSKYFGLLLIVTKDLNHHATAGIANYRSLSKKRVEGRYFWDIAQQKVVIMH